MSLFIQPEVKYTTSLSFVLCTHSLPFVGDVLWAEDRVGIDSDQLDAVGLSDFGDLVLDAHDGYALLVGFWQGGLKLVVSCDQTLEDKWRLTTLKERL